MPNIKHEKMNNIYNIKYKTDAQVHEFRRYLKKIFKNHYFSNHWEFAMALEAELANITENKHNITYMNSSVALISLLHILAMDGEGDIIVSKGVSLYPWVKSSLEYFGKDINQGGEQESKEDDIFISIEMAFAETRMKPARPDRTIVIPATLKCHEKMYNECIFVYDMSEETCFGASTGAFVSTNDEDIADKLRWMRSSYGRTGSVSVPINGNGRFSEMQAAEALSVIRCDGVKDTIIEKINSGMLSKLNIENIPHDFIGSEYTGGIIKLMVPDHDVNEMITRLNNIHLLYEIEPGLDDISEVLIRVPLGETSRTALLVILNSITR